MHKCNKCSEAKCEVMWSAIKQIVLRNQGNQDCPVVDRHGELRRHWMLDGATPSTTPGYSPPPWNTSAQCLVLLHRRKIRNELVRFACQTLERMARIFQNHLLRSVLYCIVQRG